MIINRVIFTTADRGLYVYSKISKVLSSTTDKMSRLVLLLSVLTIDMNRSVTRCWNKISPVFTKVAQFFSKSSPKNTHRSFYLNNDVFQKSPLLPNIWAMCVTKICRPIHTTIVQSGYAGRQKERRF